MFNRSDVSTLKWNIFLEKLEQFSSMTKQDPATIKPQKASYSVRNLGTHTLFKIITCNFAEKIIKTIKTVPTTMSSAVST